MLPLQVKGCKREMPWVQKGTDFKHHLQKLTFHSEALNTF